MHVYVHLPQGLEPDAWEARYLRGTVYDASPYGFHRARALGHRVTLSKDASGPVARGFRYVVMRLCFSIDVVHAWRNREAIRAADAVWTILDSEGMAIALLMKLGVVGRKPLIGNLVWAFDKWKRFNPLKRTLYRSLAREFKALTVHSNGCLPISRIAFPASPVELMYFGINVDAFTTTIPAIPADGGDDRPIRVLGIGNDPSRDWQTFLDAFAGHPRFKVTLVCKHVRDGDVARFPNVRLVRHPDMAGFRALYAQADYVIVPMSENLFSGITVALEAVASGVPVICTRTGGVPTYFSEDEVIYVPPHDAQALRDAALAPNAEARARVARDAQARFDRDDYSLDGMIARYVRLTMR